MKNITAYLGLIIISYSCADPNRELKKERVNIHEVNQIYMESIDLSFRDTTYIPIYSEIYVQDEVRKLGLTSAISIRNTSIKDTIYLEDINHYNAQGDLIHKNLENILFLAPLQSIQYVIKKRDVEQGMESSIIVIWGANSSEVRPIFQGIMISAYGRHGVSILTEGVSISRSTFK
jgi:uncharacterized protein DUF3124